MHDTETSSLRRAALLLACLSVLRWGWERGHRRDRVDGADVLADHVTATAEVVEEAGLRDRPLAPGETIDPNRASEAELDRLPGVGAATARAVVQARDSGQVFRTLDDLTAVRGIGPRLAERIAPYLGLRAGPAGRAKADRGRTGTPTAGAKIDLNRAGADELERLPGIGPALAGRIVEARAERPFASIDDLTRVPGIGPATVARLRDFATVSRSR